MYVIITCPSRQKLSDGKQERNYVRHIPRNGRDFSSSTYTVVVGSVAYFNRFLFPIA